MKVTVTGGTGFIGYYVVENLLKEGHQVLVTGTDRNKAKNISWFDKVDFVELNLKSDLSESLLYKIAAVDKLIHLAWSGLPNYKELFHFEENLMPQYFFLKRLIELGLKDITITGTCFEYGMKNGCLSADMPSNPQNSYALAKDTLRKFLEHLKNSNDFSLKWIRLFYMYGKGQSEKSILSQLDKALSNGDEFFDMTGGQQLRDYLPVEEVAINIIKYSLSSEGSFIKNVCSGIPISIRSLVENYIIQNERTIKLKLGFYPYSDFEAFAFWGSI